MARYYITNSGSNVADLFLNDRNALDELNTRLRSAGNSIDCRDGNMDILKKQVLQAVGNVEILSDKIRLFETVSKQVAAEYFNAEDSVNKGFESILSAASALNDDSSPLSIAQFKGLSNIVQSESFVGVSYPYDYLEIFEGISDSLKKARKSVSGIDDLLDLLGLESELVGAMKKTDIYRTISYTSDATKLLEAISEGDLGKFGELAEKYIKKGAGSVAKNVYGVSGFTSSSYINLGWNFVENILDIDKFSYVGTSQSMMVGAAQYLWHCTGWTMIETGSEMAYDIVEGIGGLVGYDVNKVYEDLVGAGGIEGFYKATGELGKELFGDYYTKGGIGGAVEGTIDLVGDSLSWWGSTITGLFK